MSEAYEAGLRCGYSTGYEEGKRDGLREALELRYGLVSDDLVERVDDHLWSVRIKERIRALEKEGEE